MLPGNYDFTIRKGDTAKLGVYLKTRDVITNEIGWALDAGDVVHWQIGAGPAKTSAPGGGLDADETDLAIYYPLSAAETAALTSTTYKIWVVYEDGQVKTYLTGRLVVEG